MLIRNFKKDFEPIKKGFITLSVYEKYPILKYCDLKKFNFKSII